MKIKRSAVSVLSIFALLAIPFAKAAEQTPAAPAVERAYVPVEKWAQDPDNLFGLTCRILTGGGPSPAEQSGLIKAWAGKPTMSAEASEFDTQRALEKRWDDFTNRLNAGDARALPGFIVEYTSDLGKYDFGRKEFPLIAAPKRELQKISFGLIMARPAEFAAPGSDSVETGYVPSPDTAKFLAGGYTKALSYEVWPQNETEFIWPLSLPIAPAKAEQLSRTVVAPKPIQVRVRVYGHFNEEQMVRFIGSDLSVALRFNVDKVEIVSTAAPESVLYSKSYIAPVSAHE